MKGGSGRWGGEIGGGSGGGGGGGGVTGGERERGGCDVFALRMTNGNNGERGEIGQTREEGDGEGGGRENESVRSERRMESARRRVHLTHRAYNLTSGRARTQIEAAVSILDFFGA